jgi:hypothetical protein
VEARFGELPLLGEPTGLHLHLPRVLRNAGLATSVCDVVGRDDTLYKITWEAEDQYVDMLLAYYLIRLILLAYDHPELRPSVCLALLDCTKKMHAGNRWLCFFLAAAASVNLKLTHGLIEHNTDGWRCPYGDPERHPDRLR